MISYSKVFQTNAVQHNEPVSVNRKVFQIEKRLWTDQKYYATHLLTNIFTDVAQSDRERLRWLHYNWPSGHRDTMQWKQLDCPMMLTFKDARHNVYIIN
jgi:hypothetical protein